MTSQVQKVKVMALPEIVRRRAEKQLQEYCKQRSSACKGQSAVGCHVSWQLRNDLLVQGTYRATTGR